MPRTRRSTPTTRIRVRYRTGPPGRPDRDRGGHECPRVAVRLRRNPLHARPVVRRDDAHTCSRPRTPVVGRSGAQRPVAPEASQTPGHPCLRSAHRTRSGRASVIVMLVATAALAGAGFLAVASGVDAGGDSSWFMEQLVGAATSVWSYALVFAVAVRGHSCDAALASRHKGAPRANQILRTDVSPPRK